MPYNISNEAIERKKKVLYLLINIIVNFNLS